MSAWPATGDTIPLVRAASSETALSKASGPSRMPPVIWPRSAILQSAAASSVERMSGETVSTAERIATRGVTMPSAMREIDGVLDDVALVDQRRIDVDGRVGDEERPRIGGRVDREHVADAPRGAQAGIASQRPRASVRPCAARPSSALRPRPAAPSPPPCRPPRGCARSRRSDSRRCRYCAPSAARGSSASGPTSTGSIRSSRAASTAPMSEASSTGWTTAVFNGFISRVASMSMLVAAALLAHLLDEFLARLGHDGLLRRDDLRRCRPSPGRRADWSRALRW